MFVSQRGMRLERVHAGAFIVPPNFLSMSLNWDQFPQRGRKQNANDRDVNVVRCSHFDGGVAQKETPGRQNNSLRIKLFQNQGACKTTPRRGAPGAPMFELQSATRLAAHASTAAPCLTCTNPASRIDHSPMNVLQCPAMQIDLVSAQRMLAGLNRFLEQR